MKTFLLSLLACTFLSIPSFAADPVAVCPAEADEKAVMTWNLAAVMRTYRDTLNISEEIIVGAIRADEALRLRIPNAIEEVQKAIDCGAYVLRNFDGSMIAGVILDEAKEDQAKYLELYKEMSSKTLEMFKALRDGLRAEWAKPVSDQNYQASLDLIRAIHDYENRAHRKF